MKGPNFCTTVWGVDRAGTGKGWVSYDFIQKTKDWYANFSMNFSFELDFSGVAIRKSYQIDVRRLQSASIGHSSVNWTCNNN